MAALGPGRCDRPWAARRLPPSVDDVRVVDVDLHAVSISADLTKSQEARSRAEQIDPESIPSRERRAGWAWRSRAPMASGRTTRACCTGWSWPSRPRLTRSGTHPRLGRWPPKRSITAAR